MLPGGGSVCAGEPSSSFPTKLKALGTKRDLLSRAKTRAGVLSRLPEMVCPDIFFLYFYFHFFLLVGPAYPFKCLLFDEAGMRSEQMAKLQHRELAQLLLDKCTLP